jgi:4a-hydroxytetrahydrobiopterin dehydratase
MQKLTTEEIKSQLELLNTSWSMKNNSIFKEFKFKDFVEAFSFMTAVAMRAEKQSHHPDWNNLYNKVSISMNTHDAGGITLKDFELAKAIDLVYNS